jgi:HEAT repeat protein
MSKELLTGLDRDAERLLFAGAQVARGDADLMSKREKLGPLAAKAPAVAKIVEQVEKVQKASGKAAASELLSLSAQMAQVRGAQAAPAPVEGDLAPLPAVTPMESPLSATELSLLVGALANAPDARHRPRVLRDAIERGAVHDLRILPFCVRALSDSALGYLVEEKLLPALGAVVVPELRATLNLQGKNLDARKLRALARIEGAGSKPLLVEATEKGSPDLRAAGIEALAELDPAAAEPIALKILAGDRSGDARKAAAHALANGTGDATLEALLVAFTSSEDLRDAAGASLARLAHPKTTGRARALLTPELLALGPFKAPKADTKAKKAEVEKLQREHGKKVDFFCEVLDLLAARKDQDVSAQVLSIFHDHKVKEVKNAAARALLKAGYEAAFDELAPSVYDADWETRSDFIDGVLTREPDRAFDRLGRFLDPASLKTKNHVSFAENILDHVEGESPDAAEPEDEAAAEGAEDADEGKTPGILEKDPRWTDASIALLGHDDLVNSALDVLAKVRSPKVLEAVLKLTAGKLKSNYSWRLLRVVTAYRDPRVPPVLIKFLETLNGFWARRSAYNAMREYDDAAIAPALKAWAAKKKLDKREKEEVESLLQTLERDRAISAGV